MTAVSAGHIILRPTQPVGSGRSQRGSNPGSPHQKSRVLPTELTRFPIYDDDDGDDDDDDDDAYQDNGILYKEL